MPAQQAGKSGVAETRQGAPRTQSVFAAAAAPSSAAASPAGVIRVNTNFTTSAGLDTSTLLAPEFRKYLYAPSDAQAAAPVRNASTRREAGPPSEEEVVCAQHEECELAVRCFRADPAWLQSLPTWQLEDLCLKVSGLNRACGSLEAGAKAQLQAFVTRFAEIKKLTERKSTLMRKQIETLQCGLQAMLQTARLQSIEDVIAEHARMAAANRRLAEEVEQAAVRAERCNELKLRRLQAEIEERKRTASRPWWLGAGCARDVVRQLLPYINCTLIASAAVIPTFVFLTTQPPMRCTKTLLP